MNQIITNYLNIHKREYGIEKKSDTFAFEHFCDFLIVNKYVADRFSPESVMTKDGEVGLDGVAIIVNDILVVDEDSLEAAWGKSPEDSSVRFVFIQAKTGDKFESGDIQVFIYGVRNFFLPKNERKFTNEKMEQLVYLKDKIYERSLSIRNNNPSIDMFYITCGKWIENNGLGEMISLNKQDLEKTNDFYKIEFYPYDADKIITAYKELKKKIRKTVIMEKRYTFPPMTSIRQAYGGLVKCSDFINLLQDEEGNMLHNIFEDNVRDFQGYNPVNTEIGNTIQNKEERKFFSVLNNGLTILAKKITPTGDNLEIFDYQIVNGCQTSYVLFSNKDLISNDMYVYVKLIEVEKQEILDRIVYTTNRQTEVKSEAFVSTKPFHRRLEEYYNSFNMPYRLYYERRSKQYDLDDNINKNRVVTLATQINCFVSMFLNEPHSTHRYYGELLRNYSKNLFVGDNCYEPYYISAYFLYYVNNTLKNSETKRPQFAHFKYHLILGMRWVARNKDKSKNNLKELKKESLQLIEDSKDEAKMEEYLKIASEALSEAIRELQSTIHEKNMHRSKELTALMLDKINSYLNAVNTTCYLKKGDIVHCVVKQIDRSYVNVHLKSEDIRNNGSIHISQVARRWINDLNKEFLVGDIISAKIIDDDYGPFGWKLSMLTD